MAINRVQVIWSGGALTGTGLSTFYFDSATGTAAQQVSAVAAFLTGTEDRRVNTCVWTTGADVATLNVGTGALEAITVVTQQTGTGTVGTDALPQQTQGLLRVLTTTIVAGRLLRGRIFLPGTVEADSGTTGNPSSTYRTDYDTNAATLISDANTNWMCWSATHGTAASIATANTWSRWAVLRSRRD